MKVGVLGYGRAGKRHLDNVRALGHEPYCYDSDPTVYSKNCMARREVITASDAIVVATPAECHLKDLLDCLTAGKPVLVEKPIGLTRQYDAIKQVLDRNAQATEPTPVYCGFNLRFHPQIRKIKAALATTETAYYANFVCCQFTEQQAPLTNGVCNDWLCHEVDLARYLLGPLRVIDRHASRFTADLRLVNWDNGCQVHIHSDMVATQPVRCGVIATPDVSMRYDLALDPVSNDDYRTELLEFTNLVEHGMPTQTLATGEEALSVLGICRRADV